MEQEVRLPARPEMKRALPKDGEEGVDSRDSILGCWSSWGHFLRHGKFWRFMCAQVEFEKPERHSDGGQSSVNSRYTDLELKREIYVESWPYPSGS